MAMSKPFQSCNRRSTILIAVVLAVGARLSLPAAGANDAAASGDWAGPRAEHTASALPPRAGYPPQPRPTGGEGVVPPGPLWPLAPEPAYLRTAFSTSDEAL